MQTSDGDIIVMQDATYTPCEVCAGESPLWQLGAKKITQDFKVSKPLFTIGIKCKPAEQKVKTHIAIQILLYI